MPDATVTGLTCNTTYHYRAVATNSKATSYGTDLSFTTAACPKPTESASGTRIPSATQIVDANGDIWTQGTTPACRSTANPPAHCLPGYRNGVLVSSGYQWLYLNHVVYTLGEEGHWWRFNGGDPTVGASWTDMGTTDPAGGPTESPSGTVVPTAAQIVDATGAVWTQSTTQVACPAPGKCFPGYRNGVQVNVGTQISYVNRVVYVLGWDGEWWRFNGGDPTVNSSWTDYGKTAPR